MNILIAGGSGFLGSKIIEELYGENFINISKTVKNPVCKNNLIYDLSRRDDFDLIFTKKVDLLINCIDTNEKKEQDIRREIVDSTSNLISLAKKNHIKKLIHFSINDVERVKDSYQKARILSERAVENSGLKYIIFRLSPIFGAGSKLENFMHGLKEKASRVARYGNAEDRIAPIHYKDIVQNIKFALKNPAKWDETYSLCGPEYMSFEEILERTSEKKVKVYKRAKILERIYVNMFLDPKLKRFVLSLINSYYQDSKYVHSPLVRPKIFY
ncbi:MAG: SDR family oxidoreductase [Helicobacteraceae bacterium]